MSQQPVGPVVESQVAQDRIRKLTIEKVIDNQIRVWPCRWNWLVDENKKMYEAMAGKRPLSPYDWSRFYALDKPPEKVKKAKKDKQQMDIKFQPVPDIPAKPNIPITTSGWYGFLPKVNGRSIVQERQKWCKTTVGQHDLLHSFGWPPIYD